jgi:hypothetical protein
MENKNHKFPDSFENIDAEIEFFQKIEHYKVVPEDNIFMQAAKAAAVKYSQTPIFPIGIVAVKGGEAQVMDGVSAKRRPHLARTPRMGRREAFQIKRGTLNQTLLD